MADEEVKWLIKNKDGQTEGPYSTTEIIQKIRAGYYQGEEQISLYPSGQWRAISYEESFFTELLEVLEEELDDHKSRAVMPPPLNEDILKEARENHEKEKARRKWGDEIVPEVPGQDTPALLDVEPKTKTKIKLKEKAKRGRAVEEALRKTQEQQDRRTSDDRRSTRSKRGPGYRSRRDIRSAQRRFRFFLVAVLAAVMWMIFVSDGKKDLSGERIRLLRPNEKNKSQDKQLVPLAKGIELFRKDTIEDYQLAQAVFVKHVEINQNKDALSFLCMTYRELWPYSFQDTRDGETVLAVLRIAHVHHPNSVASSTCLVVKEWVNGHYQEAVRIMDMSLRNAQNLIFFNQMLGDIKAASVQRSSSSPEGDGYREAEFYFKQVIEFWQPKPVWAKTLVQLARIKRRQRDLGTALKIYNTLLKDYPHHAVGMIEKGILEFEFDKYNLSRKYIRSGLVEKQRIPKSVEAEAYFTLAKIYEVQGDKRSALTNAQKAFAIDSSMTEVKKFIVALGGMNALNDITIDNVNMVYLGEQFMKMGKYASAQGQFRAAYEADPKNAFAALRAGQALWKLNQGKEAISWVKKSVLADPKFIRAYIVLADYLSKRYDYLNAIAALKQAKRINPKHHEVWRGFALVELRRRNYQTAIAFAEKALKLYDTDVESNLILAQAHYELRDMDLAYKYVFAATELDRSNEEVLATHAKILVALQGAYAAEQFLQGLIDEFSDKLVFRRTLGEIYIQEQKFDEAYDIFNEVLATYGRDKQTLMQMAKVLQLKEKSENYESARDFLMEAAMLDPSDAEPIFQLGKLYLDAGQAGFAKAQFDRVVQVNPKYPLAYYYSGLCLLKMGNYEEALEMAKEENRNNPDIPEPFLLMGESYFKMSIFSKDPHLANAHASSCSRNYKDAITKGYRFADDYIWLARCLRLTGALDSAESMLDEAEKLESGNPDIYREVGALNEMRGSIDKAILGYNRYLQLSPQAKDSDDIKKRIIQLELKGKEE